MSSCIAEQPSKVRHLVLAPLYTDGNGLLTTGRANASQKVVAQALGPVDSTYNTCLIKLDCGV